MSFGVRVLFNVGKPLHSDLGEIKIDLCGVRSIIKPHHGEKIMDSNTLVLSSSGFPDHDAALSFGRQAQRALLLASFDTKIGIDLGRDQVRSGSSQFVKDRVYEETGVVLHDTIHGVHVYNDDVAVSFFSMSGEGKVLHSSENFCQCLETRFSEGTKTDKSLSHAIEILTHAYMEKSILAQFVLAIAAIEAVSVRGERPTEERLLLDQVVAFLKGANATPAVKEKVISLIGNMKNESVGAACRREIEENVSREASDNFNRIYAKRSGILHGGGQGDQYEVIRFAGEVMEIAHCLISSLVQKANEL